MHTKPSRALEAVLLFTAFIAATYGFGLYLFPAMVEPIRRDIAFSWGTMGVISGFVQAGFMVSALASGLLTLRFGAMAVIKAAILVCVLALGGLAFALDTLMITILLTILGGCAAAIWVPMAEVTRGLVPKTRQAMALGLISSGTAYGVFINSLLLTTLLEHQGWRALWMATAAITALLALAGFLRLRTPTASAVADPSSTVPAIPLRLRLHGLPKWLTLAMLLMMFLNGLSCMPWETFLSAFTESEAGYSLQTSALLWRTLGIVGMVSGLAMGMLADRISIRRGLILTCLILAASCILLVKVPHAGNPALAYAATVCFGISFYAIFGLVPAYIGLMFRAGDAVLVFAAGNIALGLGGIAGNLAGGLLKELTGSFVPAYLMMAGAALCAGGLAALLPDERPPGSSEGSP